MAIYEICIRGIVNLTKEIAIEAPNAIEAERQAEELAATFEVKDWDQSDPEDVVVESIHMRPRS